MGQIDSQYGVFTPGSRQPVQWIISGVISTPFNSDQSFATFRRRSSSCFTVARRAPQVSQSSPQYAMKSFIFGLFSLFPKLWAQMPVPETVNCGWTYCRRPRRQKMHCAGAPPAQSKIHGFRSVHKIFRLSILIQWIGKLNVRFPLAPSDSAATKSVEGIGHLYDFFQKCRDF